LRRHWQTGRIIWTRKNYTFIIRKSFDETDRVIAKQAAPPHLVFEPYSLSRCRSTLCLALLILGFSALRVGCPDRSEAGHDIFKFS
jgi:hypothetical protein